MLVPVLIGAGILGLILLSKKQDGVSSAPAQLPPPAGPSFQPGPAFPPAAQPAPTVFVPAPPAAVSPAQVAPAPSAATSGQKARVTTNDPPPSGDLIMRTAPNDSAAQVPGGGAEKDGIVTVINLNASADGVWSEIDWPGGSRRPGARGFCKKKFLTVLV